MVHIIPAARIKHTASSETGGFLAYFSFKPVSQHLSVIFLSSRWLWRGEDRLRPERVVWREGGDHLQLLLLPFCLLPGLSLCNDDGHQLVQVSSACDIQNSENWFPSTATVAKRIELISELINVFLLLLPSSYDNHRIEKLLDGSWSVFWIKMASSWVCLFLYILTLVAPLACPKRFEA